MSVRNSKCIISQASYRSIFTEFLKPSLFCISHILNIHLQFIVCVCHKGESHKSYDVT